MRIAYVGPVPPHRGGIAQHGGQLAKAFTEAGHDVEITTWRSLYPRWLFKGDQPSETGENFVLRWWSPWSWMRAGRRCRGVDLVVFPWVTPFHALALRMILAFSGGAPAVAFVHEPELHERLPFSATFLRFVMRRVSGAVVHATVAREQLLAKTPLERVEVIPHPPNLPVEPTPLPPQPPIRMLLLGFVRAYKGGDIAIDVVELAAAQGLDLRLSIAGQFWDPVEAIAADLAARDLTDRVTLRPGYVPDDEVGPLIGEHHLLVAPYRSAVVSGVAALAFAAARPVVVTPVGGLPEVVTEGVNGTVAESVGPEAFLVAVERAVAALDQLSAGAANTTTEWRDVADALLQASGIDR